MKPVAIWPSTLPLVCVVNSAGFKENRMKTVVRSMATAMLVTTALAADTPRLAPGSTFTVTFPEMPPTFYAL